MIDTFKYIAVYLPILILMLLCSNGRYFNSLLSIASHVCYIEFFYHFFSRS